MPPISPLDSFVLLAVDCKRSPKSTFSRGFRAVAQAQLEQQKTHMPAKGTTKISPRQKLAVAHGRVAGKTVPEIAKAIHAAESTVAALAVSPEVKGIISRIFAAEELTMARLMRSVVASLEADMDPTSKLTPEQRERTRTQAVTVLQMGQPKFSEATPAAGSGAVPGGGVFLGDMLTHYRSIVHASPMQEPQ